MLYVCVLCTKAEALPKGCCCRYVACWFIVLAQGKGWWFAIVDDNMHKGGELGSGRSLKSNSAVATISYGTIACSAHVVLLARVPYM